MIKLNSIENFIFNRSELICMINYPFLLHLAPFYIPENRFEHKKIIFFIFIIINMINNQKSYIYNRSELILGINYPFLLYLAPFLIPKNRFKRKKIIFIIFIIINMINNEKSYL